MICINRQLKPHLLKWRKCLFWAWHATNEIYISFHSFQMKFQSNSWQKLEYPVSCFTPNNHVIKRRKSLFVLRICSVMYMLTIKSNGKYFSCLFSFLPKCSENLPSSLDITYGPWCEETCLRLFAKAKAQTSLCIRAVWSAPLLFAYWKVSYIDLLQAKCQFSS